MRAPLHKYLSRQEPTREFLESLRTRPVIIYGGGKIGTRICRSLRSYGITPVAVWDQKADRIGAIDGIPVGRPEPESPGARDAAVLITVFAQNACRAVEAELRERGMRYVYAKRSLINSILYLECHALEKAGQFSFDFATCHLCPVAKETHNRCDIYSRALAAAAGATSPLQEADAQDQLVIPSMGILITNHCNLTCIGCNHLRDLYKPSDNVRLDTDTIIEDLRRVLQAVTLIEKVVVVGGEAFVHYDLRNILQQILMLPGIGVVQIITNGTVIPKDPQLYDVLADPRVLVEISGYGDFLPPAVRGNVEEFVRILRSHKARYHLLETLDWQDFGDFQHRNYDRKQHLRVYKTCCFVSNDLFDGKLYKCSRSVFATRLGHIPDYPHDYVDVRSGTADLLRKRLREFFGNNYPQVCQHCDGTTARRVAAGVQASNTRTSTPVHGLPIAHEIPASTSPFDV